MKIYSKDGAKKLKKWHVKDDLFYKMLRNRLNKDETHYKISMTLKLIKKIFNDFS